jgi:hypothetical protein
MPPKVVFNGTEYDSVDAMPADVRAEYERVLGLLTPEQRAKLDPATSHAGAIRMNVNVRTRFKVGGKEYGSLDEMPAEVRAAYERARAGQGAAPTPIGAPAPMDQGAASERRRQLIILLIIAALAAIAVAFLRGRT